MSKQIVCGIRPYMFTDEKTKEVKTGTTFFLLEEIEESRQVKENPSLKGHGYFIPKINSFSVSSEKQNEILQGLKPLDFVNKPVNALFDSNAKIHRLELVEVKKG